LGVKVVDLVAQHYRGDDHLFIAEKRTTFRGVVVKFRNNASLNEVESVYNAKAFLRFFGRDSREIGEGVSGACWLTDEGNYPILNLTPGGPAGKLLILMTDGKRFITPYKRIVNTHWGQAFVTESTDFDELPPYVEVSILDSSRKMVLPSITICLTFENGELRAATES